jgi:hypothetical protein
MVEDFENHKTCWSCGSKAWIDSAYHQARVQTSVVVNVAGCVREMTSPFLVVDICFNCTGNDRYVLQRKILSLKPTFVEAVD